MIQTGLRFGKITIFQPEAAEPLKHLKGGLAVRDKYVGDLSPHDPDMAKGKYDWESMHDGAVLYVTGADIHDFNMFKHEHRVTLDQPDEFRFLQYKDRVDKWIAKRKSEGAQIHYVPKLPVWDQFIEDLDLAFRRFKNVLKNLKPKA